MRTRAARSGAMELHQLLVHVTPGSAGATRAWWARQTNKPTNEQSNEETNDSWYLPRDTIVVMADSAGLALLLGNSNVVWVGRMLPEDKLAPHVDAPHSDLRVTAFGDVTAVERDLSRIIKKPAGFRRVGPHQWRVWTTAKSSPPSQLLSRLERVHWVEPVAGASPLNFEATQVVLGGPTKTAWPLSDLNGTGQTIGIHDTGLDVGHCMFSNASAGPPVCLDCRHARNYTAYTDAYDFFIRREADLRNASLYYDPKELDGSTNNSPETIRDAVVMAYYHAPGVPIERAVERFCRAAESVTSNVFFAVRRARYIEVRFTGVGVPSLSYVDLKGPLGNFLDPILAVDSSGLGDPGSIDAGATVAIHPRSCYAGARDPRPEYTSPNGEQYAWVRYDLGSEREIGQIRVMGYDCPSYGTLTGIEVRFYDPKYDAYRIAVPHRNVSTTGLQANFGAGYCEDTCGRVYDGVCSDGSRSVSGAPVFPGQTWSPTPQPTPYPTFDQYDMRPGSCTHGTDCSDCGARLEESGAFAAVRFAIRQYGDIPCPMRMVPNTLAAASCTLSSAACTAPDATQRKVVAYWAYADAAADRDSHGTHVAGSAAGSPASLGAAADFAGVAPGAKIAFSDGGYVGSSQTDSLVRVRGSSPSVVAPAAQDMLGFAYSMGARVHLDGWGTDIGTSNAYSSYAAQLDAYLASHDDILAVFAAGNGQAVTAEGAAKNVLTVGASNQRLEYVNETIVPYTRALAREQFSRIACQTAHNASYIAVRIEERMNSQLGICTNQMLNPALLEMKSIYCTSPRSLIAESRWASICAQNILDPSNGQPIPPASTNDCRDWAIRWSVPDAACQREEVTTGRFQDGGEGVADFSARGPTADNRIKPDLVAPGNRVLSAYTDGSGAVGAAGAATCAATLPTDAAGAGLAAKQGTSSAAAFAAGAAAIVREYYMKGRAPGGVALANPSAALVKATLIAGGGTLVGFGDRAARLVHGGHGYLDLSRSLPLSSSGLAAYDRRSVVQGGSVTFIVRPLSQANVRVVLTWADPAALPSASTALVNDLDLVVTLLGINGNGDAARTDVALYGNNPNLTSVSQFSSARDSRNNVEAIDVYDVCAPDPAACDATYLQIEVRGTQINQGSSQVFAVAVVGAQDYTNLYTGAPTEVPTSIAPTEAPTSTVTQGPTLSPTSTVTGAPLTQNPTTGKPITVSPATNGPLTQHPTTGKPITVSPATNAPSLAPATGMPTTQGGTFAPTSAVPTTATPTDEPTSASPTLAIPPTASPTTTEPTIIYTLCPTTTQTGGPTINQILPSLAPTGSVSPTQSPILNLPPTAAPSAGPTSASPSTSPTTPAPATPAPTVCPTTIPTTRAPVPPTLSPSIAPTVEGYTYSPVTEVPTLLPNSSAPTTDSPTETPPPTMSPSSLSPSNQPTVDPTTLTPTSSSPATASPSLAPATGAPATVAPTQSPTQTEFWAHQIQIDVSYPDLACASSETPLLAAWTAAIIQRAGLGPNRAQLTTICGSIELRIVLMISSIDFGANDARRRTSELLSGVQSQGAVPFFNTSRLWVLGASAGSRVYDLGDVDVNAGFGVYVESDSSADGASASGQLAMLIVGAVCVVGGIAIAYACWSKARAEVAEADSGQDALAMDSLVSNKQPAPRSPKAAEFKGVSQSSVEVVVADGEGIRLEFDGDEEEKKIAIVEEEHDDGTQVTAI